MAQRTQFDLAGAGGLLVGVLLVCLGIGALIGLAAGDLGYGVAGGALVGVPASIAAVVLRYRGAA
jgi:hypothetical protein